MPRDYKYTGRRRRRGKGAPGWAWLLAGLVIGLFAAFLVYLKSTAERAADREVVIEMPVPEETDMSEVHRQEPPAIPPPRKPRFDFYTILPEMEVLVPEQEITGKSREGVKQVEQPGTYILQVGSFREGAKADELKARLALLGFESSVQTVTINDRETWHRVRVGPFRQLSELNAARAQLNANGINAVLLKRK
jgi:cell division protein FtsN